MLPVSDSLLLLLPSPPLRRSWQSPRNLGLAKRRNASYDRLLVAGTRYCCDDLLVDHPNVRPSLLDGAARGRRPSSISRRPRRRVRCAAAAKSSPHASAPWLTHGSPVAAKSGTRRPWCVRLPRRHPNCFVARLSWFAKARPPPLRPDRDLAEVWQEEAEPAL